MFYKEKNSIKRYNLLTAKDLIPNNHYEVVSLFGKNPNPIREVAFYNKYGEWCGIEKNHTMLAVIDNSVMLILAEKNPERYREIVLGGSYDDGKYNDKRSRTSYEDCEKLYPLDELEDGFL